MTRTVVHFVRHGEVHNPEGILYGRLAGYELSANGQRQAIAVAESLRGHDIAAVISSPLRRAVQTAAPIADSHRIEASADERMLEAENRFEGKKVAVGDGVLRHPRYWPLLRNPFLPSWGEPYLRIAHRMLAAAYAARARADGHEAVCVSHQLPIWTLRRYLEGKRLWHDPRRRECDLASVTSLVFEDELLLEVEYSKPAGSTNPRVTGA